jgi:hypothetical protein
MGQSDVWVASERKNAVRGDCPFGFVLKVRQHCRRLLWPHQIEFTLRSCRYSEQSQGIVDTRR